MTPLRVLAIATNPVSGASTRYRVTQWQPWLERAGIALELDAFFSEAAAQVLYRPGHHAAKFAQVIAGILRRRRRLIRARDTADVLLVHREAFPFGRGDVRRLLSRFPGPVVYDYDDAMFLPQRTGRSLASRVENLEAPAAVMKLSRLVLAGNSFLADYARPHCARVRILPTCVDTDRFRPLDRTAAPDPPTVGWIGSHSTARYVRALGPALGRVARRRPFSFYVVGAGQRIAFDGTSVEAAPWSLTREPQDFARCDVGVYPLPSEPWAQGKCGLKAIQFMACGVPVVAAAVGVNKDIVVDGMNGFLAASEDEWVEKLDWLLGDARLREKLGRAARETVEARYSLRANASSLIGALTEAAR